MKYVVIDVETTGVDSTNCQVLEIGAVIEDTSNVLPIEELPKFKCIINHPQYSGSAFAINMNARIFDILSKATLHQKNNVVLPSKVTEMFIDWLNKNYFNLDSYDLRHNDSELSGPINIAGKNFGVFDKLFLDNIPNWKEKIKCHRRFIDPAILFVDWKNDSTIPDLNTCLERANIKKEVSHNALEDAIDTLMCLRAKY
jgi:oligoribonuclease (3'-5' exoribonuclease)